VINNNIIRHVVTDTDEITVVTVTFSRGTHTHIWAFMVRSHCINPTSCRQVWKEFLLLIQSAANVKLQKKNHHLVQSFSSVATTSLRMNNTTVSRKW